MRHAFANKKLNRTSEHRKALLKNMLNSLIKYEQIKTTLPKAKFLKPQADKIITLGKKDNLKTTKMLVYQLQDIQSANKVKKTLSKRYEKRNGGYTRIIKAGFRYGDNAPMAIIEFVDRNIEAKRVDKKKKETSKEVENKMIGCAAIILTGLAYKNEKQYLFNGLNLLKNIIKSSIDNQGFPKSRNIRQLIFYLKYFIIIREWFKESQSLIPEYIEETIYYLGSCYAFICLIFCHMKA